MKHGLRNSLLLLGLISASTFSAAQTTVKAPAPPPASTRAAENPNEIRVLLAPELETTLVSQIVGRIAAVNVHLGQSFTKGKTLIQFDCSEQAARVDMAQAELAAARENHNSKLRLQGLQQAAEMEVSLAASNAAKARAQVNLYRAQLGQCSIPAPFSGQVVKIAVKPHQGVNQAQPLMEIISDGPLKLRLNAPAKWVKWLKIGSPFDVIIEETGKQYQARVSALNARIDAVSQTIELEATMVNKAPDLLPGMSGTARFTPPA